MKLYKLILTFTFFSIISYSLHAQKVTGTVKDDKDSPIEFANVVLTVENSDKINGVLTLADGSFELKAAKNKYKLTVSIIGYETHTGEVEVNGNDVNLGNIVLKTGAEMLGEAVVTAKLIDRKADRFVMNIAGNETVAGKNSIEILSMAPSVWVDKQKGISINGKSDIKVMVNDRIMNMSTDELQNYLETIPAEDIQSIEIITDPGAEYEANSNSGIIHIKLKKGRIGGLTGSVTSGLRIMRDNVSLNENLSLNYRKNKLSLYGSAYYNRNNWENDNTMITEFFDKNTKLTQDDDFTQKSDYLRANFGTVYEFNDKHEAGFTFETRNNLNYEGKSNSTSQLFTNNVLDKKTLANNVNSWKSNRYDASLNYKFKMDTIGSNLKVFLDYTGHHMKDNYLFETFVNDSPTSDSTYNRHMPAVYDIYAIRVDYLKKFNEKTSLSFGGRYGYAIMNYKVKHDDFIGGAWVNNPVNSDDYDYNENVAALYAKFDSKLGKLVYTLGLRYEYTGLNIAKEYKPCYNDLFPSIYLKYNLNEDKGHSVNASYNRKLSRPYYTNLNPFKEWTDQYSYSVGNPYLEPTYSDALSLGFTLFDKITFTAQYTAYNDVVRRIMMAAPEPNVSMRIFQNVDKMKMYYMGAYVPVKVTKWYNFTAQLSVAKNTYGGDFMADEPWVCRGNTQHTFTLPKEWTIAIDGWFGTKSQWGNIEIPSMGGFNGSISKRMFDKKLVATFNVWNIQGFRYAKLISKAENFLRTEKILNQSQVFNFSLTYNFSMGKNVNVKRVEKGIDEERL